MLADERRFRITEILTRQRTVSAADLTTLLGVTAATIRRDLAALERKGLLVRSHGGAVSKSSTTSFQPSWEVQGRSAKVRIGLADHSKFGNQSFAYIGPVTDLNILITGTATPQPYIQALRDAGVQVIQAGASGKTSHASAP